MAEVRTIIYPTDFSAISQESIPWVKLLAVDLGAVIHCVYVVQEPNLYYPAETGVATWPDMAELEQASTQQLKTFVAEQFADTNVAVTDKVLRGRAADEIITYAEDQHATMIVMSTHGYSGLKHIVMGSTTEAVLRQADCPVLAVPAQ